jgi:hypothetical protein
MRCGLQRIGRDHDGIRASADHYTHDRERSGQGQAQFTHGIFLVTISDGDTVRCGVLVVGH